MKFKEDKLFDKDRIIDNVMKGFEGFNFDDDEKEGIENGIKQTIDLVIKEWISFLDYLKETSNEFTKNKIENKIKELRDAELRFLETGEYEKE